MRTRRIVLKDDTDTERWRGHWDVYLVSVKWTEMTMQIQRDEEEEKAPTFTPWNGWRDDTNTERRRGSGREGAYLLSVYWSKETIRIQRDDEDDTMSSLYSYNDLKRRYRYRETKMKMGCLLCMRGMVLRNDTDTERRRWRRDVCFVCVEWS